jgi:hypothetical protein
MYWLTKVYDFIFGCHHSNLSRVFTIGGDTYIVCCLCGIKFPYSLDSMSMYSYEPEAPAQGFLTLGLNSAVALSRSKDEQRLSNPPRVVQTPGIGAG